MNIYIGKKSIVRTNTFQEAINYKKRFCFPALTNYISRERDRKVMSIYGLRRTGKTVMMYQLINDIIADDKLVYIQCEVGDSIQDLKNVVNAHLDCDYFFIDEATYLEDFINAAAILADKYADNYNKKIIMAGTDSFGFKYAASNQLYDRTHLLHTTYISFKEYNYLLGKSLDDYICYGGTLTNGSDFYNGKASQEYTNTAIAENLQHSLDHIGRDGSYGKLRKLREDDELTTFINKIVELYNRQFTASIINKRFKTHDMSSLAQIADSRDIVDTTELRHQYNESLRQEVMTKLLIKEPLINNATDEMMAQVKAFLEVLDVIYPIATSDEVIFTQPGLRYSQAASQVEILLDSDNLSYSTAERKALAAILLNDIKGQMLEDIIYYQLAKDETFNKIYRLAKYQDDSLIGEFDIVCFERNKDTAILIEVKHSADNIKEQTRHLNNTQLCDKFETKKHVKIIGKIVIYTGETLSEKAFGVNYINADDFLKDPLAMLAQLDNTETQLQQLSINQFLSRSAEASFVKAYNKALKKSQDPLTVIVLATGTLLKQGIRDGRLKKILKKIFPNTSDKQCATIIKLAKGSPR